MTERQSLQEPVQVISCINLLLDVKPGGHTSTVSIYYMCPEQQHNLWETKRIHLPLYRKTKKATGQIYDSTVTGVPAAYKAVWALSSPANDVRWSTGSVSLLKCGTGKKAGHTQRPQLPCFASINCNLLSLNLSFTQLNFSKISIEFHVFLKSTPACCFSCRQLKKHRMASSLYQKCNQL